MVDVGDTAPDFVLPMAGGDSYNDIEAFRLSDARESGPVVLAFFPAVFTSGCTDEMCAFRDSLGAFDDVDAQVFGVSADLSFAQNVFIQQEDLNFALLADQDREVIRAYDVLMEDMYGYFEVPERSVFVVDTDGTVAWKWVREGDNPDDFAEFVDDVADVVADLE